MEMKSLVCMGWENSVRIVRNILVKFKNTEV